MESRAAYLDELCELQESIEDRAKEIGQKYAHTASFVLQELHLVSARDSITRAPNMYNAVQHVEAVLSCDGMPSW